MMIRFALVNPGEQLPAFARVARRLRDGAITAVVEPSGEAARHAAETLGARASRRRRTICTPITTPSSTLGSR